MRYHTEKKPYIRVTTCNHFDRYKALKIVHEVSISIASDDLNPTYYYRKVTCEKKLPLSSWKDDPELLKQICLVNVETAPDHTSDIQIGFNDFQYDWRFIVKKAKKLGVLEWMFNHMSIKPSAEKSSLEFYLNESELESKLDMPIHCMNKYYEKALNETNATTAEQMREVTKYCIIDAINCQRLMVKRNTINKYREVASVAFISLYDSHYFAIEMKMRNILSADAWQKGILTSIISCKQMKTMKFPGAYVFPLVKGLKNKCPHAKSLKESEHKNQAEIKGLYPKEELEKKINLAEERGILALKVYMNTFYGEAENSESPFFLRVLTGGVISAGQQNIKLIANLIRSKRFSVKYRDTDFLYLVCPEECFQKCDEAYDNGNGISKEEYWSRI
ncbi:7600_t:CDS:2, partial [Funneliformis geosporum]